MKKKCTIRARTLKRNVTIGLRERVEVHLHFFAQYDIRIGNLNREKDSITVLSIFHIDLREAVTWMSLGDGYKRIQALT